MDWKKTRITLITLCVVSIALSTSWGYSGQQLTPEKQLKTLERDMLTSYVLLDFATLDRIYADEYVNINHDGTVFTKKEILAMVKGASLRLDSIPVSHSLVKVYGSSAVMTGVRKYYRAGKILGVVRYTEVWVNRRNRWQCVSGQVTTMQEKK